MKTILLMLALSCVPLSAAEITLEPVDWQDNDRLVIVLLRGTIVPGDTDRIGLAFVRAIKAKKTIIALQLNSLGGDADAGLAIADYVRRHSTKVLLRRPCWSACSFPALVALAGRNLLVRELGEIGVHQVKDTGSGVPSLDWTNYAAKRLKRAGVAALALEAMKNTPPSTMHIFSRDELMEMGALLLRDNWQWTPLE